jgi:hypothetical protein
MHLLGDFESVLPRRKDHAYVLPGRLRSQPFIADRDFRSLVVGDHSPSLIARTPPE